MNTRKLFAWLNLAYRFNVHVLFTLPRRFLTRTRDGNRFASITAGEGYLPLTPGERDAMPGAMRCIHCGLCSFATTDARDAWSEPWTFIAGPSRALDRASAAAASAPLHAHSIAGETLCPQGVPIAAVQSMIVRLTDTRPKS